MLFTIQEAIDIRNHYYPILKGEVFRVKPSSGKFVTGVLISRPKDVVQSIQKLVDAGFVDNMPFLTTSTPKIKEFGIYVLSEVEGDVIHQELDENLTEKGIDKIYPDNLTP